jgi:hypothetical protein
LVLTEGFIVASGVIQGGLSHLRLNTGTYILPISSIPVSDGVTQVGNAFTVGTIGQTICAVSIQVSANTKSISFRLQIWNVTLGVEASGIDLIAAGNSDSGDHMTVELPFTVTNIAHQYRMQVIVATAGAPNRLSIFTPNFQAALASAISGSGSVLGTVNRIAKFVGLTAVGDGSMIDDGATVSVIGGVRFTAAVSPFTTGSTVIGAGSANATYTGTNNTFFGSDTGQVITTGSNNVVVGRGSASLLTTGNVNTIVGTQSGNTLVNGSNNILIGFAADVGLAATNQAIAIGDGAIASTLGVAIGRIALSNAVNAIAIGEAAQGGSAASIAIGQNAVAVDTGSIAIGTGASTGASANVVIGYNSGNALGTGGNNVIVGTASLTSVTSGTNNTILGARSSTSITTGTANVMIGASVGFLMTTASYNVVMGASASVNIGTLRSIAIGYATVLGADDSIAIGTNATTTAANQCVIGSNSSAITSVYFGNGVTNAVPATCMLTATGGFGNNIAGGSLDIYGGASTGSARGGTVSIYISDPGAGGAGVNAPLWVGQFVGREAAAFANGVASSGFLHRASVEQRSTSVGAAVTESGKRFTNEGAGAGVTITLPASDRGLWYVFYVQAAQNLIVQAAGGNTIRVGAAVSAAAGTATSNVVGSCLILQAINATEWVALSAVGAWVVV